MRIRNSDIFDATVSHITGSELRSSSTGTGRVLKFHEQLVTRLTLELRSFHSHSGDSDPAIPSSGFSIWKITKSRRELRFRKSSHVCCVLPTPARAFRSFGIPIWNGCQKFPMIFRFPSWQCHASSHELSGQQCCTTTPESRKQSGISYFPDLISEIRNGRNGRNQCRNFQTRDFPISEIPESGFPMSEIPESVFQMSEIPESV